MELPADPTVRQDLTVQDVQREFESLPYVDRVDVVRTAEEKPIPNSTPPRYTLQAYAVVVALPLQGIERELVVHPKRDSVKRLWKRLRRVVKRRLLTPTEGGTDDTDTDSPGSEADAGKSSAAGRPSAPQDPSVPIALPSDVREAYGVLLGSMPRPGIRQFRVYNPLHVLEDELGEIPSDIIERMKGFKLLRRSIKDDRDGQEAWFVHVVALQKSGVGEVEEVAVVSRTGTTPTSGFVPPVEGAAGLAATAGEDQSHSESAGVLPVGPSVGLGAIPLRSGVVITAEMLPDDTKSLAVLLKAVIARMKAQGLEVDITKDGKVTVLGEY